ncbi:hypothetical protein C8R47DRAFT_1206544 [Mycena vitilis]|nr:hypothetical protein C8R47DRAFT_1206544 [Mycena vitilis]
MPPHSSPLNPNARPFPYPPPYPQLPPHLSISRFAAPRARHPAPSPGLGNAPSHPPPFRPTPSAPLPCDVLDRGRRSSLGPVEPLPRPGNSVDRIRAASNLQWARYRLRQPPQVRPGSLVAPQTVYTGRAMQNDGQEIYRAVFLNARLIIHDPVTGRPGMINGHADATFVAAPSDERTWAFEVPYPSMRDVQTTLTGYGSATQAEIGRQRRTGRYQINANRQIEHAPGFATNASRAAGSALAAPRLAPVPLPSFRPFRQPLPSIQSILQSSLDSPSQPLLAASPSTEAPRPTTDPRAQTSAPRQADGNRSPSDAPRPFFLTYPVNTPPRFDTRDLPRLGHEAATGHRVLLAPRISTVADPEGQPKRIDTPAPPLRLHAEFPVLKEEPSGASSDASMASVSPKEPESPALKASDVGRSIDETGDRADDSKNELPQHGLTSNVRLERLRYEARRCAMNQAVQGTPYPKYVFGTFHTPTSAASQKAEEVATSLEEDAMDTDPVDEGGKQGEDGTEKRGTTSLIPGLSYPRVPLRESTDPAPRTRQPEPRGRSASSLSSLTSASSSPYHDAVSIRSDDKPSRISTETAESRAVSDDCRSIRDSPPPALSTPDGSESEGPPSLEEAVFEDAPVSSPPSSQAYVTKLVPFPAVVNDKGTRLVLHHSAPAATGPTTTAAAVSGTSASGLTSGPTTNVNRQELEAHLGRIVRAPPSPSNHNWTLTQEWTRKHGAFLARVYSAQNNDALSFLRQADSLVKRHPEVLDIRRMRANLLIDTDVVNTLLHPYVSRESCAELADRVQRIRDTVSAYSPGLLEPDAIHDILYIPVSVDGNRLRQLSDRAFRQALMYRYAILLIARQHPDWIALYTELRNRVLAFIQYLTELFRRRNWDLDETLLHQLAPIPPPYLHLHEYSRLRILNYTFAAHGQTDVVREIDAFLRYRFRETEVVAHLLYAGLFEPNDVVRERDGSFKAVSRRTAPTTYRASLRCSPIFHSAYRTFQELQQAVATSRS